MAQSFKVLGQVNPTANSQANVYSVPVGTEAVISTITVCNQSATNNSFSLIMMPEGDFADPANAKNFIIRGAVVPAADTLVLTMGLTGAANTVVACNTNSANMSFSVFGSEVTTA
jgi:hypothetical protein